MNLQIIIKKSGDELWGRIESKSHLFVPVTVGENLKEVVGNLKILIKDYLKHEGKEDKFWSKIKLSDTNFTFAYDVQDFFKIYNFLNQSKIAEVAGMNAGLLRQYSSGVVYPSLKQAKKIESAIRKVAKELNEVSLYVA